MARDGDRFDAGRAGRSGGMTHAALEAVLLIGSPVVGRRLARRLMGPPAELLMNPARSDVVPGPRPVVARAPSMAAGP
ncbi:hypothetical protein ACFQ0Q_40195 [Streptomyces aureus]